MSDLMFRTASTDRTILEAIIEAAEIHGGKWLAIEDPVSGKLTYKRLLAATAILGAKLMPLAREGRAVGVMLPTSNGAVVTALALMSAGRVPAMINFTSGAANVLGACRAAEVDTILTARAFVEKARLRKTHRPGGKAGAHRLPGRHSQVGELLRQAARRATREKTAGGAQTRRLGGDPVHLRHGRLAQGRRAVAPQRAGERRAGRGAYRFRTRGQIVHGVAGVPLLRLHGRHRAAAYFRRPDLPLSFAAALPHRAGTRLWHMRHLHVRHRYVPRRLRAHGEPLRLPLAALHRGRRRADQGIDAPDLSGKVRHCAFSKATA